MATYRDIFKKTLYGSELYQIYQTIDDNPRNLLIVMDMTYEQLQKARIFAKRVFDVDPSQWTRTVVNQLRTKALKRSTLYTNARTFGFDVDDYERLFSKVVGNHAYIGTPKDKIFIRLYIIDDLHVICDDRDIAKFEEYIGRFI